MLSPALRVSHRDDPYYRYRPQPQLLKIQNAGAPGVHTIDVHGDLDATGTWPALPIPDEYDRWVTAASTDPIPLTQAVEEFLDWQALDKSRGPNTVRAYHQDLTIFLTYCAAVDVAMLSQVDRVLLRSYQSNLARRSDCGVVLSAPTRHRRLVALRSFLKFCAREEWSPGDLGVTIDLPKLPRRLPKPLDAGELERMTADPAAGDELDAAGLRDRALVAFLISTGCRISEALGLDRVDSNLVQSRWFGYRHSAASGTARRAVHRCGGLVIRIRLWAARRSSGGAGR